MPSRINCRVARGVRPSPHTFSRGNWLFSNSETCSPRRARWVAVADPAGPAPTTITSDSMEPDHQVDWGRLVRPMAGL